MKVSDQFPRYAEEELFSLDRVEPYRTTMQNHLDEDLKGYSEWFTNYHRLRLMSSLLKEHLPDQSLRVLDIGCGAFASKVLVAPLARHSYVGVDYTEGFNNLFPFLQEKGWVDRTELVIGDALSLSFDDASFDLIIMHDIFYEKSISFEAMFNRYQSCLKPGGYFLFDVMDERLRWIWQLFGRGDLYRRYRLEALESIINTHAFEIIECVPGIYNKRGINRMLRLLLWKAFGLSNDYVIMLRRNP